MAKIKEYSSEGVLLVCSDLHGHLEDFLRMREIFEHDEQAKMLFLGDLVHGIECPKEIWNPDWGPYYEDNSAELVRQFFELQSKYPGRVDCLLGNHEHGHIGGPPVGRAPTYSQQAVELHFKLKDRIPDYRERFNRFPIMALTDSGIAFTHAAPMFLKNITFDEIREMQYTGYDRYSVEAMSKVHPLGRFLWPRFAEAERASRFFENISTQERKINIGVYGHDPVEAGYEKMASNQLNLSSSFRIHQQNKFFLAIDLSKKYKTVEDIKKGEELRRLYDR